MVLSVCVVVMDLYDSRLYHRRCNKSLHDNLGVCVPTTTHSWWSATWYNTFSYGSVATMSVWHILKPPKYSWWRNQMETFSALLAICAGNSPVPGEFHAQRPVTRSFDVFFDLRLNKRLSKQWWGWWFETPSHPLWRHFNYILLWH